MMSRSSCPWCSSEFPLIPIPFVRDDGFDPFLPGLCVSNHLRILSEGGRGHIKGPESQLVTALGPTVNALVIPSNTSSFGQAIMAILSDLQMVKMKNSRPEKYVDLSKA